MPPRPIQQYRSLTARAVLIPTVYFAISLVVTACLSLPKAHVVIHEDLRGSVYLEAMPDGSSGTAHPISLDPGVIARVLRGILVQEQQRILQTLVTGQPIPVPAFSDEDTAFLAPHIASALSQATALQQVGLRVARSTGSGTETTGGTLSAHAGSLHFSLTHYRYNPERPSLDSKPGRQLPDPTGAGQYRVLFFPQSAQKPSADTPSSLLNKNPHLTVMVDYEALARVPESPHALSNSLQESEKHIPKPEQAHTPDVKHELPPATVEELQSMRAVIEKQAKELEALKHEVESLRRHRTEADTTSPKPKARRNPAPRTQGTMP